MPSEARERRKWAARNPPATAADRRRARAVAARTAEEFRERGATAVVLGGSWAAGRARRASDIDLWVFGLRSGSEVLWRDPFQVVVDRRTVARELHELRHPPRLAGSVPGWRTPVILHDTGGVARRLRAEALRFRWSSVDTECDRWAAGQMVWWSEEVVKLVRALALGSASTAGVQRHLLADRLGLVMAIHQRRFWGSQNEFWEQNADAIGGEWARAQRGALGVDGGSWRRTCEAALRLYALTARAVWVTLNDEQRSIVTFALRVAGQPVPSAPTGRVRRVTKRSR
jgi:predicted nucleotidyltransferase